MTMFLHWAAATIDNAGAAINFDNGFVAGSFANAGTGVYTMTLVNATDPTEVSILVTPYAFGGILPVVTYRAALAADGVTITISLFDPLGVPTNSPFTVVVSRFSPG